MRKIAITTASLLFAGLALTAPVQAQQTGGNASIIAYINTLPKETLSAQEKQDLLWMREEEKLARDVYQVLYAVWKLPAFNNIAKSEQNHMDLCKVLIDRYGLTDPITSNKVGDFNSPVLKTIFNTLVLFGINSVLHAEVVGNFIEDLDIVDLRHAMAAADNRDLNTVYQNLCLGSRNHLRNFYKLLDAQNVKYPGLVMSWTEIQAIVTTPNEKGGVDENGVPLP
jgi:hypothetical protein